MTITLERPVSSGPMTDDFLTSAEVGKLIGAKGVEGRTVNMYRRLSKPGGRYARMPFPEPAGISGGRPYWLPRQVPDIKAWDAARLGTGSGATGRPRKAK